MRTVVLTGATGFIGTHVVKAALAAGYSVRVLLRPGEVHTLPADVAVSPWDLDCGEDPAPLLKGADALCHMGAFIPANYADPGVAEACLRINGLGTLRLLDAARRAGVARFVHVSSGNTYARRGDLLQVLKEDAPLFPSAHATYYLGSKVLAELYVDHWRRIGQIDTCILRLSSVYGPGMSQKGLLPYLARELTARNQVSLANGGQYGTDFVFVSDVARAVIAVLFSAAGGPINIGSGYRTTARELAQAFVELLHGDPGLITEEPLSADPDLGFHALDIERARHEIGFVPTRLDQGLRAYLASLGVAV